MSVYTEQYNGYNISRDGTFGQFIIKPIKAGSVPKKLRGSFTRVDFARRTIDLHGKSKADDKEKSTS